MKFEWYTKKGKLKLRYKLLFIVLGIVGGLALAAILEHFYWKKKLRS